MAYPQLVDGQPRVLPRALGWFSLALGATEILAPNKLSVAIGAQPSTTIVRLACGVREVLAGIAVLRRPNKAMPMWMRVAGDALDLTLLGLAMRGKRANRLRLGLAIGAVVAVTVADVIAGMRNRDE
jgi:hypothetical protein